MEAVAKEAPKAKTYPDDKRVMLKIKAKSLAEEARIIRKEERKLPGPSALRSELHWHRITDVRYEARATHIAYGMVKGLPIDKIEKSSTRTDHLWNKVQAMCKKYGPMQGQAELLSRCKD